MHLIDESGAKYLDLLSGIGVNALGYGHPAIERAIVNQSRALIHTSNLFYHEGQAELALRLTERTGIGSRVLLQHRHRSVGRRAEAGARTCRAAAQRRQADRNKVPGAGAELSWAHIRVDVDDVQGEISRAIRAGACRALSLCGLTMWPTLRAKFSNDVCAILRRSDPGRRRHSAADAGVLCRSARSWRIPRAHF